MQQNLTQFISKFINNRKKCGFIKYKIRLISKYFLFMLLNVVKTFNHLFQISYLEIFKNFRIKVKIIYNRKLESSLKYKSEHTIIFIVFIKSNLLNKMQYKNLIMNKDQISLRRELLACQQIFFFCSSFFFYIHTFCLS